MTPNEVCEALKSIGADVSRRTLLHYEEAELIPKPERGGGGKKGRFTNYPEWTVEEAFTAWSFIHGKYGHGTSFFGDKTPRISPSAVKHFRDEYYLEEEYNKEYEQFKDTEEYRQMLVDDENKKQESLNESEESLRLYSLYKFKEKDNWDQLRIESRQHVNIGFGLLWQSERLYAKALLEKRALIK